MDGHGIDWEMITAGEYKRNVTMFGRNTDADRAKLKAELEDVHELFKSAVATYRPNLDLGKVATGEHRSEEHTSALQSLMRNSSAVVCLKKKNTNHNQET